MFNLLKIFLPLYIYFNPYLKKKLFSPLRLKCLAPSLNASHRSLHYFFWWTQRRYVYSYSHITMSSCVKISFLTNFYELCLSANNWYLYLSLWANSFTRRVSPKIGNLTILTNLYLGYNKFEGFFSVLLAFWE